MISKKKKVFTEILRDFPAKIANSIGFFGRKQVISNKKKSQNREFKRFFRPKTGDLQKKRASSQKCHEVRCQFTKSTKITVANTNFGFDLHSSSPTPVNFFGAQSSLRGGAQFSFGGHGRGMPPRGAGSGTMTQKWAPQTRYALQPNTVCVIKPYAESTL